MKLRWFVAFLFNHTEQKVFFGCCPLVTTILNILKNNVESVRNDNAFLEHAAEVTTAQSTSEAV